ncbi:MAG: arginine--tRNA ligase [Nitrosopumilus sp. BACL13 MAG-121220-bin23]|nr:MAG: arginine--tRNA ligase [Nitrosopumilus sp. BACL13 MAG-121220-bin23]
MTFQLILDEIKNNLKKILNDLSISNVHFSVEVAKPGFGDVSSNIAFLLAKELKKNPKEIMQILFEKYSQCSSTLVLKTEAHPSGYLNFFADWTKLGKLILSESYLDTFGAVDIGNNSNIIVEHTSVNPNKALHIGHIRNIVVGDTVSRILTKANYNVHVLNYIDDSGLQVADIIVGFKHFKFDEEPPNGKKFDHYCGDDVYVKTTQKYELDSSLEEIRKNTLKELEDGNSETAAFGDMITRKVLAGQLETCWNLNVSYDCLNFESQIIRSGLWSKIFEKLKEMGLIEFENEGKNAKCWVIRGDNNEDDKVIVRSNGTATYIAKDIPYAAWKLGLLDDPFYYQKYDANQPNSKTLWQTSLNNDAATPQNFTAQKVITVIDSRQERLQKIITTLMEKFNSIPDSYIHLGYESVTLSSDTAKTLGLETDGKQAQMSGRKGVYVSADSVCELLKQKITEETKKRHPEMEDSKIEKIAQSVSIGTLRYEMIKQDLDKIITFDLAKSLSLEGDTAPYIQYAYARASRILEKSGIKPTTDVDFSLLQETSELNLVKTIGLFNLQVRDAANNFAPKVIARYCHDLAVAFNSFYEHVKVLDSDNDELKSSRICLVNSFNITLEKALDLLGISAPNRM